MSDERFECAEYAGCTEDFCAYPGDEFCEHDARRRDEDDESNEDSSEQPTTEER